MHFLGTIIEVVMVTMGVVFLAGFMGISFDDYIEKRRKQQ